MTKMKNFTFFFIWILFMAVNSARAQNIEGIIKSKPFTINGSVSANAGLYANNGVDDRSAPYRYGISARLNMSVYSFKFPIYASFRDNSFTYGYNYSRFRINPQWKWIKLSIGDTYMNFNPYTLQGRTVRGAGIELTPGKFRFKALYGNVEDLNAFQDTLLLGTYREPTYTRKLAGASVGFGGRVSYFDLYAVKSWDKLDSLDGAKFYEDFKRKDNVVLGSTLNLRFLKRLKFKADFGISILTDNLESFTESVYVAENPVTGYGFEANGSSNTSYGGNFSLGYSGNTYSINGGVRYIQPYFQPLSLTYINTDILHYTIGGSLSLFNNKAFLAGEVGIQNNNLSGIKLSTANSVILNLTGNFRLSKEFSLSTVFTNFTQDYIARSIVIEDLYTYAITNSNLNGSLKYRKKIGENALTARLSAGKTGFSTVSDNEDAFASYDSFNSSLNLGYNIDHLGLNISTGTSYRIYNKEDSSTGAIGINGQVDKRFLEDKLTLNYRGRYDLTERNEKRDGHTLINTVGLSYKLNKKSSLGADVSHLIRAYTYRDGFQETRSSVRYVHRF